MSTLFDQPPSQPIAEAAAPVISPVGRSYLRLHLTPEVGPIRARNLLQRFGDVESVFSASIRELEQTENVGRKVAEAVFASRGGEGVEREIEQATARGARILCWADPEYPALLKRINDPPVCLYVRGRLEAEDGVAVAIVGSRKCSHYGLEQARRFAEGLARAGLTVVSGLARGIDGVAHHGAVIAGGRTLAVLGNGLNHVYPPEHEELSQRVIEHGALISELPMDTAPDAKNFPPRNRIIIGLALGVLVVEASHRSGALITARLAGDYNRESFALPGRVDQPQYCAGTNALIRDGKAQLVTCVEDVLDGLSEVGRIMKGELAAAPNAAGPSGRAESPGESPQQQTLVELSEEEARVLKAVTVEPTGVASLQMQTELDPGRLLSLLTSLQMKGAVKQLPGSLFVRKGG